MDGEGIDRFVFDKYNCNAHFNKFEFFVEEFQYRVKKNCGKKVKVIDRDTGTVGTYSVNVCADILTELCERDISECCIQVQYSSDCCFVRVIRGSTDTKKGSVYKFVSL